MQKVRIKKNGRELMVDNNVAHTLIDSGVADLVTKEGKTVSISKGIFEAPKDKMISPARKKIRNK